MKSSSDSACSVCESQRSHTSPSAPSYSCRPSPGPARATSRDRRPPGRHYGRPSTATSPPDATPASPLICCQLPGRGGWTNHTDLYWHHGFTTTMGLFRIITLRAEQAGLGHVAPHDLRRTAAGILHRATAADGGHLFDLLDIERVLGHSDPATTMRSYLEPMDTGVLDRAARVLD